MAGMSKKIHSQKIQKTEADVCSRGIGVEGGLMEFRNKTLFKDEKYIKSGKLGLFTMSEVRFFIRSEGK